MITGIRLAGHQLVEPHFDRLDKRVVPVVDIVKEKVLADSCFCSYSLVISNDFVW
ncbi:MAG: hypothetical protein K2I47_09480 [Odoribacter sp.]|nr:hypothetical protein [Odoribacter sp.]